MVPLCPRPCAALLTMRVQLSAVTYMLEVYTPLVAASAMAALGLLRYVLAMAFPLFTINSQFSFLFFRSVFFY